MYIDDDQVVIGTSQLSLTSDAGTEIYFGSASSVANITSLGNMVIKSQASKTMGIGANNQDDSISIDSSENVSITGGTLTVSDKITATSGLQLGNNIIYASDGGSTITLDTSDSVTIAGDLTITGGRVTFVNGEIVNNETDDTIEIVSQSLVINNVSAGNSTIAAFSADGSDSKLILYEGSVAKWSIGHDGSDSNDTLHWDYNNTSVAGASKMSLDKSGNLSVAGGIIGTRASVTNLADNGSIPITSTCVNIDANGSARTGIRFGGAGTAGQFIFVNNTGGEDLTFHNTEGTALVRGIQAAHDTMEPNFMGMFVSDGTYWNYIGGQVDTQPDVGMSAS